MSSRVARAIAVIFSTVAILTTVMALPARADVQGRICQLYADPQGNKYCLGADSISNGVAVTEKLKSNNGGRQIFVHDLHEQYATGDEIYLLEFASDHSKCVASTNDGLSVTIKPCSGSNGVRWALIDQPNDFWLNVYSTDTVHHQTAYYLTGRSNGSQYIIRQLDFSGGFQQFTIV
jgi:hypothetical protein